MSVAAGHDDFQAAIRDVPSHDVEAVSPGVLAVRHNRRPRGVHAQHRTGSTVSEQGRGNDVRFRPVVGTKRKGAEFDHQEQDPAASPGAGGSASQPHDPAPAAKTEDRKTLDIATERQRLHQPRV